MRTVPIERRPERRRIANPLSVDHDVRQTLGQDDLFDRGQALIVRAGVERDSRADEVDARHRIARPDAAAGNAGSRATERRNACTPSPVAGVIGHGRTELRLQLGAGAEDLLEVLLGVRVERRVTYSVSADIEPLAFLVLRRQRILDRIGRMDVVAHAVAIAVDHRAGDRVVIQPDHADRPVVVADDADQIADEFGNGRVERAPNDVVHSSIFRRAARFERDQLEAEIVPLCRRLDDGLRAVGIRQFDLTFVTAVGGGGRLH